MRDALDVSLLNLKWIRSQKHRIAAIIPMLSLIVMVSVFWSLRQPGLTLAGDASCRIQEHTHDDTCGISVCVCDLSEEPHIHDQSCYQVNLEEHQSDALPICEQTEDPHIHVDSCYETVVSQQTETNLICDNQDEGHNHEDACYETVVTSGQEEQVLICQLISEPHRHTENCYTVEAQAEQEVILICSLPENHTHDDSCYEWKLTCEQEAHVHRIDCYSDDTADVETMLDWQEMFADYPYTGNLREDLVGIAKSQVGYSESTQNFEVDDNGIRRGYTRYGAWYGTPYRDWSAMFVSFCLHYAGADPENTPGNTGAASMAELWNIQGKFAPADSYNPISGDLVFFEDNTVGIVTETYNTTFRVIRGDMDDSVCIDLLTLTEESVTGWGLTEGTLDSNEGEQAEADLNEQLLPTTSQAENNDLLDISQGPAFFIFEDGELMPRLQKYSIRSTPLITDLLPYLEANGGNYFFTLLDFNNQELPKDDAGNYIVQANTGYKLTLSINSPEGFLPGTYQYQIPNGLMVDGGEGTLMWANYYTIYT